MASAFMRMLSQGKITPPWWMEPNLVLEVVMGSRAYGCESPDKSDFDIRGLFIPQKAAVFPATAGLIVGYDEIPKCENFQAPQDGQPPIVDSDRRREYDFQLFAITHFVKLAAGGKANQIEMLFSKETNIKHCTPVGRHLLDNRHLFLSKLVWKEFRGYAANQFGKMRDKQATGKRLELIQKHGYDVKFAYNCLRLLIECEQILTEGDLDLMRGAEEYKAIRRGDWSFERMQQEFEVRKLAVEQIQNRSKLPEKPDSNAIKRVLLECLEMHYGNLTHVVQKPGIEIQTLRDIDALLGKVRPLL